MPRCRADRRGADRCRARRWSSRGPMRGLPAQRARRARSAQCPARRRAGDGRLRRRPQPTSRAAAAALLSPRAARPGQLDALARRWRRRRRGRRRRDPLADAGPDHRGRGRGGRHRDQGPEAAHARGDEDGAQPDRAVRRHRRRTQRRRPVRRCRSRRCWRGSRRRTRAWGGADRSSDVTDRILTITLDRPAAMNAFTAQMLHELIAAFDRADADDAVRVVIVTGAAGAPSAPGPTCRPAGDLRLCARLAGADAIAVRADGFGRLRPSRRARWRRAARRCASSSR